MPDPWLALLIFTQRIAVSIVASWTIAHWHSQSMPFPHLTRREMGEPPGNVWLILAPRDLQIMSDREVYWVSRSEDDDWRPLPSTLPSCVDLPRTGLL